MESVFVPFIRTLGSEGFTTQNITTVKRFSRVILTLNKVFCRLVELFITL